MSKKRQDRTGTGNSRGRRKTWADNDMVSAMDAVKSGRFTITAAATQFSVPRKTLDDRIKGRVTHGSKPGVSTALTSIEEESLVSYLIYMANRGFPLTRTMVKALLGQLQRDVEHVIDLILSMDQRKSGGLCSNSGTLNWHFFVSGLTVIVTTMMVQSAQYVDVTN